MGGLSMALSPRMSVGTLCSQEHTLVSIGECTVPMVYILTVLSLLYDILLQL